MKLLNKIADAMIQQNPDWSTQDEYEIFEYVDEKITLLDNDLKAQIANTIVSQLREWEAGMYDKMGSYYYDITH